MLKSTVLKVISASSRYPLLPQAFVVFVPKEFIVPSITLAGQTLYLVGKAKDILGGFMSFKEAFTAYFITTAVGLAISTAVGILIFAIIDTELGAYLNEQSYEMARAFMERFNTPEEIMIESLNELKEVDNFSIANQVKSYFTGLIMQAVIGLLIGLIFKKADPNAID